MEKATVNLYELTGNSCEIGFQLGKKMMANPLLIEMQKSTSGIFSDAQITQMNEMFDRYCPGLSDELRGFAEAVDASENQLPYYAGTCLTPGCSLIAALPSLTKDGHVLVARNYEFSHKMNGFSFGKTKVNGRMHILAAAPCYLVVARASTNAGLWLDRLHVVYLSAILNLCANLRSSACNFGRSSVLCLKIARMLTKL